MYFVRPQIRLGFKGFWIWFSGKFSKVIEFSEFSFGEFRDMKINFHHLWSLLPSVKVST